MGESRLDDMRLLVAVGRCRHFGRAAAALGMPTSTLSKRIAGLEKSLGIQLLNRSTRRVELTEDGEIYLNRAESIVEEALRAHEELRDRKSAPRGRLRISMPYALATEVGMFWLGEFAGLYPDINFEINTVPAHIDLIADQFDVAIRYGQLSDSQLSARCAGLFIRFLYAAPAYLAEHGAPEHPRDLIGHECIRLADAPHSWTLYRAESSVTVNIKGRFLCDATVLTRPLAVAGLGVVQLISQLAAPEETAGHLVRILPEWRSEGIPLQILTPTRLLPRRTRLLVDFLAAKVRNLAL